MEDEKITSFELSDGTVYKLTKKYIKSLTWDRFMYMPLYVSHDGDYLVFPVTAVKELPDDATLFEFKIVEGQ